MQIDLSKDKQKIRKYILGRIKNFAKHGSAGPGEDDSPVQAIYLGFYAAQGGYIYLVFDTRPGFNMDGEWNNHIDEYTMFDLPKWCEFYEKACEGERVTLIKDDGKRINIEIAADEDEDEEEDDDDDDDEYDESDFEDELNTYFGTMLTNLMLELRDDGSLANLPLAKGAFMVVEEFDGHYFWPVPASCRVTGRILPR
ncbi:MAG: hypothetical protein SFV81_08280 [Pirellulaceae bacterium]|nr:hypothetical protein [Pirellulaceae bacterium]